MFPSSLLVLCIHICLTENIVQASPTRSAYTGKKRGRKPGSKNKTSSSKQQGTVKSNGEQTQEKNKEKKRKPMSKEEDILSQKGPFIHIEGNWNSPNYVRLACLFFLLPTIFFFRHLFRNDQQLTIFHYISGECCQQYK